MPHKAVCGYKIRQNLSIPQILTTELPLIENFVVGMEGMDESFGKDGKKGKRGKIEKDDRILAQSEDRFLDRRTKEQNYIDST